LRFGNSQTLGCTRCGFLGDLYLARTLGDTLVADEDEEMDSDGQTDKELYDALKDLGYNFGKYGTSKFDVINMDNTFNGNYVKGVAYYGYTNMFL
jgi:hypothetical protein